MYWIEKAAQCPILRGVSPELLLELFGNLQFQIKSYGKDEVLAMQGDEVNRLMILLEGSARGEMTDFSGHVIKIEDVPAPKPLAGAFLFGNENRFPVDVLANEPVKVLVIYRGEFLKLLRMNETIQMNYLNLVGSKAQFLSKKIKFLSFKTIKGKIAHYLIGLKPDAAGVITIPASQQELADLFGVARPSVARALGELEDERLISAQNRSVRILDKPGLIKYLNE
ncbi:MAG: Crp/Fnr family transcriptional regulator [Bacteroidia bacterium]|nr:Crp/Fnr family transcriptional regulator [Bacteroidia bacterium]